MSITEHDDFVDDDDGELLERLNPSWAFALDDVPQPGAWAQWGACRLAPPSIFFVRRGESAAPAKAICASCGVHDQCLEYALDAGQQLKGIWGGASERERRRLNRERRTAPPPLQVVPDAPKERKPPAARGELYDTLVALAQHPGRWALVRAYPSPNSAGAIASLLRNGRKATPPGDWTFEARVNDAGGSDLYARHGEAAHA